MPNYIQHLKGDGPCDGLELWLVSALLQTPINMVQEDKVWSTSQKGIDSAFVTIALTSYGSGVMCTLEAETVSEDNVIPETPSETSAMSARGGCPTMKQGASPSTSSIMGLGTETETEYLMEGPQPKYTVLVDHGTSKECVCPVCENVVVSRLALIQHLHENHPDARPYFCDKCEKSYHMVADLHSYNSIIHKLYCTL